MNKLELINSGHRYTHVAFLFSVKYIFAAIVNIFDFLDVLKFNIVAKKRAANNKQRCTTPIIHII